MSKKPKIVSVVVPIVLFAAGLVASTPSAEAIIVGTTWAGGSCPSSKYYYSVAKLAASGGNHRARFGQTHIGDTRWQTWTAVTSTPTKLHWENGWYLVDTNRVEVDANSGSISEKSNKCS